MSLESVQLGHYRLTRFLKGGGMGEVYLAEDLAFPREVAIKVMKGEESLYPNSQAAQEAERLFQREMKVIGALDHPHILTLLEAGEQNVNHEHITYMVMPYCPAGSLADWIRQYHGSSLLSPQEVSQLLLQEGDALQYAHDQHILHLDIKPQNFLVRRQQDPIALPSLLLADFGVAKIASTTRMSGTPRGTYLYMAPEQLGNKPVPASDQYSLAIMVYELLVGSTPFEGAHPQVIPYQHAQVMPDPPSKVNASLPQALDAVVLRALAKKPEERFGSVREFAQAFAAALKSRSDQRGSRGSVRVTQTAQEQQTMPSYQSNPPYKRSVLPPSSPRRQEIWRPPRRSKLGLWWALLFGVIAGIVDLTIVVYQNAHSTGTDVSVVFCIILIIAGFVTGRIVLRKWTGTLAGVIAAITFVATGTIYYHSGLVWAFLFTLIAIGAIFGFIGGWLGTLGHARKQE